jgi:hypothetical protein
MYQLSICSRIEENHGKPRSSWPVAGPSGCKLTSSQQSGIKYANPNVSPYLCVLALFERKIYIFLLHFFYVIVVISRIFKDSVCTSQEPPYISMKTTNRLMLFRETVAVYCENHTEQIYTLCEQNAVFKTLKQAYT